MSIKNCASYNKKGECRHQRVVRFESRGRNLLGCDENCSFFQPKKVFNSDDLPVEVTDNRTGEKVMVYKGCGGCDG